MKLYALIAGSALAMSAHAESFFQVEAGLGVSFGQTISDGVWYQQGTPGDKLNTTTPAYMLGVTGEAYRTGRVDVRYHLDYVYFGTQSASCTCVWDADYDAVQHRIINGSPSSFMNPIYGSGHVQGVALTADVGYNYGPWRVGAEAGPWVFWQTWNEHQYASDGATYDLSHRTVAQLSWVAGANVSRGPFALSYRYYSLPQRWNPYPALLRAAHVVMATYRF